jgi:tripeptide aminopeptidase
MKNAIPISQAEKAALKEALIERFVRYAKIWTTSDPKTAETPSTPGQWDLAKLLVEDLRSAGVRDIELTDHCYVIARISGSGEWGVGSGEEGGEEGYGVWGMG